MSADKRWRLVCYDIRDPARWRNVYRIVRGAGTRVQYSVFRCRLDDRELAKLRWELSQVMNAVDSLLVVDLCPRCASNVISQNHVEGWTDPPATYRVISKATGSHAARQANQPREPSLPPIARAADLNELSDDGHAIALNVRRAVEDPLAQPDVAGHTEESPGAALQTTTVDPAQISNEQSADQVPPNVQPLAPKPTR